MLWYVEMKNSDFAVIDILYCLEIWEYCRFCYFWNW